MSVSEKPFEGVIGKTIKDSTPVFEVTTYPPLGTPNVVIILIDDLGFSHFNCFGSTLDTPNINRLADGGLRYTNYHVTPLCSPTRASLLTGRNSHEVGMRSVSNFNTGFPNMRGHVSNHAGLVAEVLREEGFTTFALGKWHLTQMANASAAGPFDQWPLGRGFDRFYGFLDGETDQFYPELVYDNHHVPVPRSVEDGYHVSEDLVDHGLEFVRDAKSIRPDRPFFMYLAFGATHAPHQAPRKFLEKHKGRYDSGWDVARQEWFARQISLGVIPPDTQLAPRNPGVEEWSTLSDNQKRLACRLQEAFAAFLEHTDEQIGRVMDGLAELGELDNTIIFLQSDNGASQEGGPFGVLHEMKFFNMIMEMPDEAIHRIDDIGGPSSHSNYPWGWAQAGNTPFKWYKQNTHEGGVHVPLVVHWPDGIKAKGELRHQFHSVNDIVPTIYEALGVTPPAVLRGFEQLPITGTSLKYSLNNGDAEPQKTVQFFENHGHRAIYAHGWKAVTRHTPNVPYEDDDWELYNLAVDRSECVNLAAQMPEKLSELVELWWREAEQHNGLPLDDRGVELFGGTIGERSPNRPDRHYTYYPPIARIPTQAGPGLGGRSWDMTVSLTRSLGDDGVLYSTGTENSGVSLFIQNNKLVFDYNYFGAHSIIDSTIDVPSGTSVVGVEFRRAKKDATVALLVNNQKVGELQIPAIMRMISSVGASIGRDEGSTISKRYADEFTFRGKIHRLDIQLLTENRAEASVNAQTSQRETMGRQ